MKVIKVLFLVLVIVTSLACSTMEIFSKPTPTPLPTSTDTPTSTPTHTNTQTPSMTPSPTLVPIQAIRRDDGTMLVLDQHNGYQFSMPDWWPTVDISGSSLSCAVRSGYYKFGMLFYNYYDLTVTPLLIDADMSLNTILTNELAHPELLVDAARSFAIGMFEALNETEVNQVIVNYGQMTNGMGTPLAFVEFYLRGVAKAGPYYLDRGYYLYFKPVETLLVTIKFYKDGDKIFNADEEQLIRMIRDSIELIEP